MMVPWLGLWRLTVLQGFEAAIKVTVNRGRAGYLGHSADTENNSHTLRVCLEGLILSKRQPPPFKAVIRKFDCRMNQAP